VKHEHGQATSEKVSKPTEGSISGIQTDNPADAAADIGASLDQNEAVSPVSKPDTQTKPNTPAWRREPLSNFALDPDGKVIVRGNGKPARRGGKPAKPKAGDVLADGTTFGVSGSGSPVQVSVSRVVIPDEPGAGQGGEGPGAETSGGPSGGSVGPAFGRLLARLGFKAAERRGGEKWKPDDDESELIGEAAAETFGNRRVPWWLVLPIGVLAYVVARIEFSKREAATDGDNTPLRNGADTERQDAVGPATGPLGTRF
jgi:hypothetical protein